MNGKNIKTNTAINSPCWLVYIIGRVDTQLLNSNSKITKSFDHFSTAPYRDRFTTRATATRCDNNFCHRPSGLNGECRLINIRMGP